MNNLIQRLREAKTLQDADPILNKLGANGPIRKLVEASILQRMSPNPASYQYGVSMLNEAIQYLDAEEEPAEPESPGLKRKGDHFVKEELLANDNTGKRNENSEQSSENEEPYRGEGKKEGDEDMINSPDTENQWGETEHKEEEHRDEEAPFPKNLHELGGLDPEIAKQMGNHMPKIPPMDTSAQMKQMRYTIKKYHETIVKPLLKRSRIQEAVIKKLSQQIRETQARAGTLSYDLGSMKSNTSTRVRETISEPRSIGEFVSQVQNLKNDYNLEEKRSSIIQMNNDLSA